MDIVEKLKSRFDDRRIVQPDEVAREACREIERFRRICRIMKSLAVDLHRKHYPQIVQWAPSDDPETLILQIDNMTAELVRMVGTPEPQSPAVMPDHRED